jgi:tetratricopeptide (TPR) repeat protein
VLAIAAEACYHRGDYGRAERLAGAGLALREEDRPSWHCLFVLSVVALARGAFADVVDHSLTAAALAPVPRDSFGIAALAAAYAGDLQQARTLNDIGSAAAVSPSMKSWASYVEGEIAGLDGRRELAEEHYLRAIELARTSGATFLVGIASVGLLSVRASAGEVREALSGYRDVIDYFARTGNWTHQWTTLRNLADLLRRLGDDRTAAVLETAAAQAPDAPAAPTVVPAAQRPQPPDVPYEVPVGRAEVLDLARLAIEQRLTS